MTRSAFLLMIPVAAWAKKKYHTEWSYTYEGAAGQFFASFWSTDDYAKVWGRNHQPFRVEREGRTDEQFQLLLASIVDHMGGEGLHE